MKKILNINKAKRTTKLSQIGELCVILKRHFPTNPNIKSIPLDNNYTSNKE